MKLTYFKTDENNTSVSCESNDADRLYVSKEELDANDIPFDIEDAQIQRLKTYHKFEGEIRMSKSGAGIVIHKNVFVSNDTDFDLQLLTPSPPIK